MLMEYIIKWHRMNACLSKLLSGVTDVESLSSHKLIDAVVYVWRWKVDRKKYAFLLPSANGATSEDFTHQQLTPAPVA